METVIFFQKESRECYKRITEYRNRETDNIGEKRLNDNMIEHYMARHYHCSKVMRLLMDIS